MCAPFACRCMESKTSFEPAFMIFPALGSKKSALRPTSWVGQRRSRASGSFSFGSGLGSVMPSVAWCTTNSPPTVLRVAPSRDSVTSLYSIAAT